MATKERIHQLIDSLPDTPETDLRLDDIEHKLEPNGSGDHDDQPLDEARIRTLREVSERFARIDWLPREDAWR